MQSSNGAKELRIRNQQPQMLIFLVKMNPVCPIGQSHLFIKKVRFHVIWAKTFSTHGTSSSLSHNLGCLVLLQSLHDTLVTPPVEDCSNLGGLFHQFYEDTCRPLRL